MTIYLSDQDPDGDYYSRIERIEDSFGNAFTYSQGIDFSSALPVQTPTTLRVGDTVMFRCEGTDPQGRALTWRLGHVPPGEPFEAQGDHVDLIWNVKPTDTGKKWVIVQLRHEGGYHRHVGGDLLTDAAVIFFYRVLPPS